ncbi:MAG: hypothetical protein ACI310_06920 [Bacilli bacterium]
MFEKIFGKKKSIQRSLVRSFIISIALVIIITIIGFFILVVPSINTKLIEVNISSKENIREIIYVVRRFLGLTIVNIILISIILIRINTKKMLQPIQKLSEATKKVTSRRL